MTNENRLGLLRLAASLFVAFALCACSTKPEAVTIYANVGTYPTLYSAAQVWSTTEPTLFMYGRSETLSQDPNDYPPAVKKLNSRWGWDDQVDGMLDFIDDHNSPHVTLYLQDAYYPIALTLQAKTEATVEARFIEDGTFTYDQYNTLRGDDAPEVWRTYNTDYQGWIADVARGDVTNLPTRLTPQSTVAPCYQGASNRVQHLAIIENIVNKSVTDEVKKCDLIQKRAVDLYEEMDETRKQAFYKLTQFDRERFLGYFNASPKPNIVVTGTNSASAATHIALVKVVFNRFAEDYDLFFKPHAGGFGGGAKGGEHGDTIGLEHDIILFPAEMPFEILMWTLNDEISIMGGFPSTLYLSQPDPKKVHFYFAASEANLSAAEKYMYDAGLMPNVVFIDPANPHWP